MCVLGATRRHLTYASSDNHCEKLATEKTNIISHKKTTRKYYNSIVNYSIYSVVVRSYFYV